MREFGSAPSICALRIVLPTGTGKTETMLAAYCHEPRRTLVVVPSDSLRSQIGTKFATLGVLPAVGALEGDFLAPVVAIMKSRLNSKDEAFELTQQANVIVATAAVLRRCSSEVFDTFVGMTAQLYIDESHHVAAKTWTAIAEAFAGKRTVQFIATPFREGVASHTGRRTVITALYANGGVDLADIARHVGHSDSTTTAGYVHSLGHRPSDTARRAAELLDSGL